MVLAVTGPHLSRRAELFALGATALAALLTVVVPTAFVLALPATCAVVAAAAPAGRRLPAALVPWVPLSVAVVLSGAT